MSRLYDVVAFLLIAVFWGFSFTVVEVGLSSFPPLLLMAFRYDIAGLILLGYAMLTSETWRPTTRADVIAICGGGVLWIALGNGIWFVGQALTSSVLSGVMPSLIPIVTIVCSWFLLPNDRLTLSSLVGLFVSFAGAMILIWPAGQLTLSAGFLGKSLLLVGVIGAALGSVVIRWASPPLSTVPLVAWSVLVGAGSIHLLSSIVGGAWSGNVTTLGILSVAYLSTVATVIAYILYFRLLERYSAIEITLVTYLVPLVAAATGVVFFDEPITARIAGGHSSLAKRQIARLRRVGRRANFWVGENDSSV
ncbi:DMT family transporter [Halobacterium salinarum]|uniref:DMT family transporter n=1 Tax=Halobacterium salinarum TaxID=2242 RepID=UPI0025534370|nr:EamA family transporter [Halobacterium salinarum]MDL0134019.1 EamA family transporter [Halobacterium salinarum]